MDAFNCNGIWERIRCTNELKEISQIKILKSIDERNVKTKSEEFFPIYLHWLLNNHYNVIKILCTLLYRFNSTYNNIIKTLLLMFFSKFNNLSTQAEQEDFNFKMLSKKSKKCHRKFNLVLPDAPIYRIVRCLIVCVFTRLKIQNLQSKNQAINGTFFKYLFFQFSRP